MSRTRLSRAGLGVLVLAGAFVSAVRPASADGFHTVAVRLTKVGCPARVTTTSGAVTFTVTVPTSSAVTEFEVLDGDRLVAEVEGVGPTLPGSFSVTLAPGRYVTDCGDGEKRGVLVVTGTPVPALGPASQGAVDSYRTATTAGIGRVGATTKQLMLLVQQGNVAGARTAYLDARSAYEKIEPVAVKVGQFDDRIDARKGEVANDAWGGFHRIEQALWQRRTTNDMGPVAVRLYFDIQALANFVPGVQWEPATIVNGAVQTLREVTAVELRGLEERWSHTDLVAVDGGIGAAHNAYDAVRPLVGAKDAVLGQAIDARFAAVDEALAGLRSPEGYPPLQTVAAATRAELAGAVDSLRAALTQATPDLLAARST